MILLMRENALFVIVSKFNLFNFFVETGIDNKYNFIIVNNFFVVG